MKITHKHPPHSPEERAELLREFYRACVRALAEEKASVDAPKAAAYSG